MKIIHTSDWHLGGNWKGHDRTDELFGQVERVCEIVLEKRADVLLVAGDVFERVGRNVLVEATKRLAQSLKPLVEQGVHIVLVPGNHDLREYFASLKLLLELNTGSSERVHIAAGIDIFDINNVQFVCLPYPERELLEKYDKTRKIENISREERNRFLSDNLVEIVRMLDKERIDAARPAVFVAHLQIDGVKVSAESEKEMHYLDDICLSANDLPTNVAYIALGHIHRQQRIAHTVPAWYSGSFDCFNVGECNDEKGVLLVEINDVANATIEPIRLEVTKFVDLKICSSEIEAKSLEYVDSRKIYGRIEIDCALDVDVMAARRTASNLFRHCTITMNSELSKTTIFNSVQNPNDRRQTILDYLDERFIDDADLPELKVLAEQLTKEISDAFA